ncbi:MAG: helix-turn-helix domain-containing protein, partial [Prevotellaceae bacterium]|nr:helix-turn-helix domain-containing protein [Prevotellaceae bacterium]
GSIKTNPEIIEFAKQERPIDELTRILAVERPKYLREKLIHAFDWQQALDLSMSFTSLTLEKTIPDSAEAFAMALNIQNRMSEQQNVAKKFQEQLHLLLNNFEKDGDILTLKNRVQKAVIYFYKDFTENVLNPLDAHLDSLKKASKVKQYTTAVRDIKSGLEEFIVKLKRVAYGEILLTEEIDFETIAPQTNKPSDSKRSKPEKEKGASFFITLEMFRKGMDMEDIAVERNLAQSTIEGHLTAFVKTGEILIHELMSEEKVKIIQPLVENFNEQSSLSEIKQKLGDEFSYGDIKAVINHLTYLSKS